MFCGASSFPNVDEDPSAPQTPRSSKKKQNSSKNPYSSRGLDKFSSVVSELEARREKIISRTGTQGVALVRFMSSNSKDWIPIIVRMKDEAQNQIVSPKKPSPQLAQPKPKEQPNAKMTPPPPLQKQQQQPAKVAEGEVLKAVEAMPEKKAKQSLWRWRPSYKAPAVTVLILFSLVMFGRVFAICCTSVLWYLMPTLKGEEESRNSRRKTSKKKDYVRRLSDKRLLSAGVPAASQGRLTQPAGVAPELASERIQLKRGI